MSDEALVDLGPLLTLPLDARPELLTEVAPSTHPLALLPVRLETRFFGRPDGTSELRVRVFPDQIHIDSHDPRLTVEEIEAGRRYWELRWRAASDVARHRSAWRLLTDRFESGRAAWIARRLEPVNQANRPTAPLSDGAPFVDPPRFPDVGEPTRLTRTPRAAALPTRWIVTAYGGGGVLAVVTGRDIVDDLAVGPDPDDALAPTDADPSALGIDEGMRWMVDFDRAEALGMAVRLPLAGPLETAAVDVLVVAGVAETGSDDAGRDGSERLAALLDAHHHTDGLAFVAPGTPTNNSGEQRAGFVSRDLRGEQSFAVEWPHPAPQIGPLTDAARLGAAVGFTAEQSTATLGRIAGAADGDEPVAAALQAALWPSTWGYYLSQFARRVDADGRDWARDHARQHVRPAGPLPTLRCGRQPYGVLPVTSLAGWAGAGPDAARLGRLRQLLAALRDQVWRPALIDVARIGRTDPAADLVDVLRGEAASNGYAVRRALGPHYLRHLRQFLGEDLDAIGFLTRLQQLTAGVPARVGLGGALSLGEFVYEGQYYPIGVPLVRPGDGAADGSLAYIGELLAADPDALAGPVPDAAVPLLHALLRHALLREHAEAAARLLAGPGRTAGQLIADAELVDLVPDPNPTTTWDWQRSQPVPGTDPPRTVRDHLGAITDFSAPEVRRLGELRDAMAQLGTVDPDVLERLLPPVLDAAAYRLDAWITSLATLRLAELRDVQPTGLRIGGYGWLEDLRFEPGTPVTELPPDEPGPLVAAPDDPGFILAPSLNQASTAALLREAHLAHGGARDSPYAIKLTSDRVRLAERLFEGVRQGIPLGELLGYDVERRLHDGHLDELIDDLRRIAPPPERDGDDAVASRTQLDGLVLQRKWADDQEGVLRDIQGLPAADPRRDRLIRILAWLDTAVDAAADALTAEGVHQFARGNLSRATTLDVVAGGQAPPPQLELMRTPRTGTPITHRVVLVLDADERVPATSGWAGADHSPRARVEPRLDAWAAELLGPATGIDVTVAVLGDTGNTAAELVEAGSIIAEHRVPLADLGLSALDLVWISGDAGAASELAQRAYAAAAPGGGGTPLLRLVLEPAADRSQRALTDLLEMAGALRRLVARARPLDGADLQPAHADPDRRVDLDELEARLEDAQQAFTERHGALRDLLDTTEPTVGAISEQLTAIAGFGLPAGPIPASGPDDAVATSGSAAYVGASAVLAEVSRRLADAERERTAPDGEPEPARRERLTRRLQSIFGPGFVALPVFRAVTAPDLAAGLSSPALLGDDPLAVHTWVMRMERVRPGLAAMTMPYRLALVIGTGPGLEPGVAHVPHAGDRAWVGLAVGEDGSGISPDGLLSLIVQGGSDIDLAGPLAGLLVDEWTEVVPSRTEDAGLAFRYDPPDAMAPQAVLLAVPPDPAEAWTVGSLNQVLLETLDLVHLRAIGPQLLDAPGHYLPATMLAFNTDGDVVSTDPNALIAPAAG